MGGGGGTCGACHLLLALSPRRSFVRIGGGGKVVCGETTSPAEAMKPEEFGGTRV